MEAAIALAKEAVSIATNVGYGDLREDMLRSLIQQRVFLETPDHLRPLMLTATLSLSLLTVSTLSDFIARTAEGSEVI